jgi:hypothetical protein
LQPGGTPRAPPGRPQPAVVDVLVEVLVLVLVDDVVVVVVEVEPVVVVVVELVVVVVVHGCVTVTVVGSVTVTVTVFVLRGGQAPSLSPRRRCAFTALFATLIVTSFFDALRWHMTTFGFFGFFFAPTCGPAIATGRGEAGDEDGKENQLQLHPEPPVRRAVLRATPHAGTSQNRAR